MKRPATAFRARKEHERERAFRREYKAWHAQAETAPRGSREVLLAAEALAARYPERTELQREIATRAEAAGDHARVVSALTVLVREGDDTTKTRLRLARALRSLGREEEAILALREVAGGELVEASFLAKYGVFCREAGLLDESIDAFRRSTELNRVYRPAWEGLAEALDAAGRRDEARAARDELAGVPPKLTPAEVVRRIRGELPESDTRFVVNIGCHDGVSGDDPCFELFQEGYPGIALDAGDYPELHENLPQPEVRKLLRTFVTPSNAAEILIANGCPKRPTLLKIDIDSFDGVLLESLLVELEPLVIQIEVNGEIPPPIAFAVHYDPRLRHSARAGFHGCSVSFAATVGRAHGYELLEVDLRNPPHGQGVILVRGEHLALFGIEGPVDERTLFLAEPVVIGGFRRSGFDSPTWREETDYDALLTEIWDAAVAGSVDQNGTPLPFLLQAVKPPSARSSWPVT